jgi:hypothetical protein
VSDWVIVAIVAAIVVLGTVGQRVGWIDLSNKAKTSGTRSGALGAGDEVFNPTKYESQLELDRQTLMPAPAPLAGDEDKGVYSGTVRIQLDSNRT